MQCPSCHSENVIKNGRIHNHKPKFACKACGRQFIENPQIGLTQCQPNSEMSPFVQSRTVPSRMRGYGVWAGAGVMLPRPLQGWSGAGL
ncbi:transposase-like zinc-binding domain-containing protein [Thiorhodospira sibirica]|uniref:IS1/IS1595 family N-terminal zinc-binding domain-containing protein n=1 Tax=Thiorhodospira sibirica TaxID=154347 RepID=UPI003AB9B9B7